MHTRAHFVLLTLFFFFISICIFHFHPNYFAVALRAQVHNSSMLSKENAHTNKTNIPYDIYTITNLIWIGFRMRVARTSDRQKERTVYLFYFRWMLVVLFLALTLYLPHTRTFSFSFARRLSHGSTHRQL